LAPVIGPVLNVLGYFALGRSVAPGGNASTLRDNTRATLQALDDARGGVDRIKAALTKLREALQAARAQADAVPGRTAFKPIIAQVEQTVDRPTFVTIDGQPVQSGTVTVSLGTRPLVVGYERANRTPLAVGEALKSLAATVGTLVATVGADRNGGFAADVSTLLRDAAFTTAVNTPDAAAIDAGLARIDATLAKAEALRFTIDTRAAAAAQVDLGSLLLAAAPIRTSARAGRNDS
jgi:hypothetical protein